MNLPFWDDIKGNLTWEEKVAYIAYKLSLQGVKDPPLAHGFDPGFYTRVMAIPANMIFIGRRHNLGHELHLISGECIYITPDGKKHHVKAPYFLKSNPGFYAVAFTLTEITVVTRHPNPTNKRDIDKLEDEIFAPAEKTLSLGKAVSDRFHYAFLLAKHNVDEVKVNEIISYQGDYMEIPNDAWYVGASQRNGLGIFSKCSFSEGEIIGLAGKDGKRSKLGRMVNHSEKPNCEILLSLYDDLILSAVKEIKPYEELTIDYEKMLVHPGMKEVLCLAQLA